MKNIDTGNISKPFIFSYSVNDKVTCTINSVYLTNFKLTTNEVFFTTEHGKKQSCKCLHH